MEETCHRCGATTTNELFCQHCGSPQVRLEVSDEQTPYAAGASVAQGSQGIFWRAAVQSVLMVAVPVGLLSSLLDFGIFWVLAGGFAAVALYRRKAAGPLSLRAGWRIGLLLGLLSAFISSAVDGLSMLVERYGLHHGPVIDQKLTGMTAEMTDQMLRSNPEAAQQIPWFIHFWSTPDGHAAIVLFISAFAGIMMIGFSTLGGAVGARVFGARQRLSTHS